MDLNGTVCKYFSDYIRYLFLIIKYSVDACIIHISYIAYFVVMPDLPVVLVKIINTNLPLFLKLYNTPINS